MFKATSDTISGSLAHDTTCVETGFKPTLKLYLRMSSLAFSEIGTSGGKMSVSCQFITFLYVSCGVSEQNGGYPGKSH